MTAAELDAEAGRTRREYSQAKRELAALQEKARRLGERMQEVGKILVVEPENLIFTHESHDPQFQSRLQNLPNSGEFAELQTLLELTNQIRDSILKIRRLREAVTRLEGQDPESGESSPQSPDNVRRMYRG